MAARSATRPRRDAATRRTSAFVLAALLLAIAAASTESEPTPDPATAAAEPKVLRIGAASSLRNVLDDFNATIFAESHPDVRVEIAFGASNVLAAQLRAGAPLDLLLSADERIANDLAQQGFTEAPVTFAGNRLVVVVSQEFAPELASARDLLRTEVRRIAIPEHTVPVGHYARSWLSDQGVLEPLEKRIVRTEHARATLATVDQGNADVAIVYHSDVRHAKSARVAFEIAALDQPRIAYAGAVVKGSSAEAVAGAFLGELRELRTSALFIRDGFSLPPGPAP